MIILVYFLMVFIHIFFSYHNFFVDFPFIFVFLISLLKSPIVSMFFAFFAGIFSDFYQSIPLGLSSFVYVLLSYFITMMRQNIEYNTVFSRFVNFVALNLAVMILTLSVEYFFGVKVLFSFKSFLYPFVNFAFFEFFWFLTKRLEISKDRNFIKV